LEHVSPPRDANEETRVLAYDWPEGTVVWAEPIGGVDLRLEDMGADTDSIVITSDETVEGNDNVWALASDDGSVRWSRRLPIGEAVPVLDDSHVYLPIDGDDSESVTNQVRAMSKATGEVAWRFEVQTPPRTGVSVDDERVYLVADNELYAIDSETGSPEWRFSPETDSRIRGDANGLPIVCRDTLLLGSAFSDEAPARVRAVSKDTGELRWSFGVDGTSVQSPIPVDGALYTVVEDRSEEDTQAVLYSFYR
jgi:outer membrane protein assembly factor BamB